MFRFVGIRTYSKGCRSIPQRIGGPTAVQAFARTAGPERAGQIRAYVTWAGDRLRRRLALGIAVGRIAMIPGSYLRHITRPDGRR